ncbi:SH3 domain-containing protein [Endozoicomonas sp. SM1973]|uniref:SH3 domain-containing protein n=1 Tax=Spartinivicinus marinus TaxID=2994442 RepID=A0A853IBJ7_9GAMM|nr:SH3 domain-containing protein [Spartinivicinus marinus]MCX4027363.1 SH3 domain-containing protein [Spartinivicinus marinus]NYZ69212.1 SH3 domain-containing protein [Spartinivicinus marinus]
MKQKKPLFTCLIVLLQGFTALSAYGAVYIKVKGVVASDVLNIRANASAKAEIIGSIPADEQCVVNLGCKNSWCRVEYKDNKGWVTSKYIQTQNCRLVPTNKERHQSLLTIPVMSSLPILKAEGQVSELNQSAVDFSLEIAGDFEEAKEQLIHQQNDSAESADKTTVTVIRDGFLDDSTRGERWDIKLMKQPTGKWQTHSVTVAHRCWPGRGYEFYSKEPCN